jgi:hypothetical protein
VAKRLDGGRILIVLGALALLVSLFLDWYKARDFDGFAASAWTAFELVDLLLAVLAIVAILGALAPALPAVRDAIPDWALTAAGPTALVVVVISLIDPPPLAQGADLDTGAWIAFAAAAAMTVGSLLAVARISLVVSVREREPAVEPRDEPDDMPPEAPAVDVPDEGDTRPMRID